MWRQPSLRQAHGKLSAVQPDKAWQSRVERALLPAAFDFATLSSQALKMRTASARTEAVARADSRLPVKVTSLLLNASHRKSSYFKKSRTPSGASPTYPSKDNPFRKERNDPEGVEPSPVTLMGYPCFRYTTGPSQ